MPVRNYANAPSHTIPLGVSNGTTTSITVDSITGWPAAPFVAIIEPDTALEECVDVTAVVGLVLTCTRGIDGTTASAHAAGVKITHGYIARDATEANQHINGTANVHGTTGSLVDTGSTQTIAGPKTMSGTLTANGALNANGGGTLAGSFTFSQPPIIDGAFQRNLQPTKQIFTAAGAGTYTKPGNLKFIVVEAVGAGGAGGGAAISAAGTGAAGAGGGGGAYSRRIIPAASLAATENLSVGTGGTVGTAGANPGNAGGNTTFGTVPFVTAGGGGGGAGGAAAQNNAQTGGNGGTATGGDVNIPGQDGAVGRSAAGTPVGGQGGSSGLAFGGGAQECTNVNSGPGNAGSLYGGGGSGGANRDTSGTVARSGGAGANGIIVVWEYYS